MKAGFFFVLVLLSFFGYSQAPVSGFINLPEGWSKKIYLSVIYDYREMTLISQSHIIAVEDIDSLNHFSFDEDLFADKELIYRLHVVPNDGEIEVFLADFSEEGFGYNFLVFQAVQGEHVLVSSGSASEIFGKPESENIAVSTWRVLNEKNNNFQKDSYDLGEEEKIHLLDPFCNDLIAYGQNKSAVTRVIASSFLLKEGVDLSDYYLEVFERNRDFYETLKSELHENYPFYEDRLAKELALIDLQLNGGEVNVLRAENRILYVFIFVLVAVCIGVSLLYFFPRNKKVSLTKQESLIKELIIAGKSNKEIADELFISVSTVKTHINTLYKKVGVSSRKELQIRN